jgi:hypothetical protein
MMERRKRFREACEAGAETLPEEEREEFVRVCMEGVELPVNIIDKDTLEIRAGSGWEGYSWHRITREDVKEYYETQAGNILSGLRRLGTIVGDWRAIEAIEKTYALSPPRA